MSGIAVLSKTYLDVIASQESEAGQTQLEREYVIYGKLVDVKDLEKAASQEHQEQWEIRGEKKDDLRYFGSVRVRAAYANEGDGDAGRDIKHTLTIKTLQRDGEGKDEVELPCSADVFEQVKRLCTGGMTKVRYCFPITHEGQDLVWEVDVYTDANDELVTWCKLDLEVQKPLKTLPPYPVQLTDVLDTQPEHRSAAQKAFVEDLMDKHFVRPNPYPKTGDK